MPTPTLLAPSQSIYPFMGTELVDLLWFGADFPGLIPVFPGCLLLWCWRQLKSRHKIFKMNLVDNICLSPSPSFHFRIFWDLFSFNHHPFPWLGEPNQGGVFLLLMGWVVHSKCLNFGLSLKSLQKLILIYAKNFLNYIACLPEKMTEQISSYHCHCSVRANVCIALSHLNLGVYSLALLHISQTYL